MPQLPPLQNGHNYSSYVLGLCRMTQVLSSKALKTGNSVAQRWSMWPLELKGLGSNAGYIVYYLCDLSQLKLIAVCLSFPLCKRGMIIDWGLNLLEQFLFHMKCYFSLLLSFIFIQNLWDSCCCLTCVSDMETEAQKLNFLPKVMQSMADLDVKASILTLNLPLPSSLKRLSLLQISLSNWAHKPAPLAGVGGIGEVLRGIFPLPCSRGGSSTWESLGHSVLAVPTTGGGYGVGRGSSSRGGSSWYRKDAGFFGRPGWCPPPMPASVKVGSGKGSNTGGCAHVSPSQQPQGRCWWGRVFSVVPGLHPPKEAEGFATCGLEGLLMRPQDISVRNS